MKQRGSLWSQMLRMCKSVFGRTWTNLVRAISRYGEVNGEQCAASFAYYAFFSLFPLILLVVAIGTLFVSDREQAARRLVIQIEEYTPLQQNDRDVVMNTVEGVIRHGWGVGILGFLTLVWSSLRFFQALVLGINRAWGAKDYDWWRLPLRNLLMIGIVLSAVCSDRIKILPAPVWHLFDPIHQLQSRIRSIWYHHGSAILDLSFRSNR